MDICPKILKLLKKRKAVVAVYLRSLPIRAAEEKNIPRPSRELMNCK